MLIECLRRRQHPKTGKKGSEVRFDQWPTAPGTPFHDREATPAAVYLFRPLDPSDENSPHVADVPHRAHQMRLFESNGAFAPYEAPNRASTIERPAAVAAVAPSTTITAQPVTPFVPEPDDTKAPPQTVAPEKLDETQLKTAVEAFLKLPTKDIKAQLATFPREMLIVALVELEAVTTPEKRRGLIETIKAHLGPQDLS